MKKMILMSSVATLLLLSGCGSSSSDDGDTQTQNSGTSTSMQSVTIDASAGGFANAATSPYKYFSFATGSLVDINDSQAETSTAWDIAFKRTSTKLNGGVSGPANVEGALADKQSEFYDGSGNEIVATFTSATASSELSEFTNADSNITAFTADKDVAAIDGGWWYEYNINTHSLSAKTDNYFIVRSSDSAGFAKMHVVDFTQNGYAMDDIELQLFIQKDAQSAFGSAVQLNIDFTTETSPIYYDFETESKVTANDNWDLRIDNSFDIWMNSGVHGGGSGGVFGVFTSANDTYTNGNNIPGYFADSQAGIFKDNSWYGYSLEGNHKLWPNYRTYIIDTDSTDANATKYKLQLTSFYSAAGESGHISFRYDEVQ